MTRKAVEILAPCGSFEIMQAAISAGADACYFGGSRFGARAFADNFSTEETLRAIRYAHLHGCKSYLTVNTLLKDSEFADLYEDLSPCYEAGLDAVIVQDLGVFRLISREFPDLPIHVSTQMSISSVEGAAMMKRLGATRVVPARELSLTDLSAIKDAVDIELEVFTHGAMCYSMSGRCLMSSLAGGRSGNRGRCAQTCRKCYDGSYLLSMKDMCTLEILPEILAAGVDSLKIEGRMKSKVYVASAVSAYRDTVDEIMAGVFSEKKAKERKEKLAEVFNRGGFCTGYYQGAKEDLTTKNDPGHSGVPVGILASVGGGKCNVRLTKSIVAGDILEIPTDGEEDVRITVGQEGKDGQTVALSAPKTKLMKKGSVVRRMQSAIVLSEIEDRLNKGNRIPVSAEFTGKIGELPKLVLRPEFRKLSDVTGVSEGEQILEASKKPVDNLTGMIEDKLFSFGGTDYVLSSSELSVNENVFLPGSVLKKLRRDAIADLEERIAKHYERTLPEKTQDGRAEKTSDATNHDGYCVRIMTSEQLHAVLETGIAIRYLILEGELMLAEEDYLNAHLPAGTALVLALPDVHEKRDEGPVHLPNPMIRGIYINNPDGLARVANHEKHPQTETYIIGGFLYANNKEAVSMICEILSAHEAKVFFEAGRELSIGELAELDLPNAIYPVYGYEPVMITRQCVKRSKNSCDRKSSVTKIKDDRGNSYMALSRCDRDYNMILNGVPLAVADDKLPLAGMRSFRFTIEDADEARRILLGELPEGRTGGHYRRGVT